MHNKCLYMNYDEQLLIIILIDIYYYILLTCIDLRVIGDDVQLKLILCKGGGGRFSFKINKWIKNQFNCIQI